MERIEAHFDYHKGGWVVKLAETIFDPDKRIAEKTASDRLALYHTDAVLQADLGRLKKALRRYGHHDDPCNALEGECICGFEQALKKGG